MLYWKVGTKFKPVSFQIDDWLWAWHTQTGCILRSRGGSKTHDFVNWIIFRVLRTREVWLWLACKGGQLQQARVYFEASPFVKQIRPTKTSTYLVDLWNGCTIRCGIISTSNLGLRCDGIFYDEFEDLQPKQEIEVYPQMYGMMTASNVHKEMFAGTRWIGTLFDDKCDSLPVRIRPWGECPWLVNAGAIQHEIDEGVKPGWEIDLLYECIATLPGGKFFHNMQYHKKFNYDINMVDYGIDFGPLDRVVGVIIDQPNPGDKGVCYIVEESEVDIEANHAALDHLENNNVEAEGGGYNDDAKYDAKALLMSRRIGARRVVTNNKWKKQRKMRARSFEIIYIVKESCPNTWADMRKTTFGLNGYWDKNRQNPQHWTDAFMHAIGAGMAPKAFDPGSDHNRTKDRFKYLQKLKK